MATNGLGGMRLRISSRTLFALTTVLCLALYWRSRPSNIAARFVAAIENKDYQAADAYFNDRRDRPIEAFMNRDHRNKIIASRIKQSLGDWFRGVTAVQIILHQQTTKH